MSSKDSISWNMFQQKWISRRSLIRSAAGTAGAGLLVGSGLGTQAVAGDDDEGEHNKCKALPRPIPHISTPPGAHFFFPGPPDGSAPSTFPHFPNAGFDPSTITDFKGVIAQADLNFAGTGTDLNTGESAPYTFHTDWRFFKGTFVAIDGIERHGTMTEI
jgi:hypothetical protein